MTRLQKQREREEQVRERAEAAKEERRAKQDERMHNAQAAREGLMLEKATRARLENLKVEDPPPPPPPSLSPSPPRR